jgi:hypothetical protein
MSKKNKQTHTWRSKKDSDYEAQDVLMAYWEVECESISDKYTVQEISAMDLFKQWVELILKHYPDGLIPIYWAVRCENQSDSEKMPFQFPVTDFDKDFLTHYTHPINSVTGDRLNWLDLPVVDKHWNSKPDDSDYKGGFIQEVTGWKPSILQPYVYLPALTNFLQT